MGVRNMFRKSLKNMGIETFMDIASRWVQCRRFSSGNFPAIGWQASRPVQLISEF
ncbi:MAG: hypothetical protein K2Y31_13535 [Burkholderiales bacterium]|nr:hypothetical protein [Burkholderiales bacterium]